MLSGLNLLQVGVARPPRGLSRLIKHPPENTHTRTHTRARTKHSRLFLLAFQFPLETGSAFAFAACVSCLPRIRRGGGSPRVLTPRSCIYTLFVDVQSCLSPNSQHLLQPIPPSRRRPAAGKITVQHFGVDTRARLLSAHGFFLHLLYTNLAPRET